MYPSKLIRNYMRCYRRIYMKVYSIFKYDRRLISPGKEANNAKLPAWVVERK